MRFVTLLLTLLFALPSLAQTIVFKDVKVIPMTSPKVLEKQNVLVKDGRIVSISKIAAIPENAVVIDGTGKYLMPGLAEMHGHIPAVDAKGGLLEDTLFLYTAAGITTVRGMLGQPGHLELRERVKRNELVSPTLYLAGPLFNDQTVNSPQEAIDRVRQQKKEGWDLLKVHNGLTMEEYDAMAKTAKEVGIRFGGHVPAAVGLRHAIYMGQETIEHLDGYLESLDGLKEPVQDKRVANAVNYSKEHGVWVVPTMALWEVLFGTIPLETLQGYHELKYAPKGAVEAWSKAYEARMKDTPRELANLVIANRKKVLRALYEGGVKILMGTDAPQQFSVPGFSLWRELRRMSEVGMSPYDILRTGTANVGEYFAKQDSFGTIEPGKRADLVLLNANPLDNIANVERIQGVMVRGRWLSREDIDAGLAKIEAKFKR